MALSEWITGKEAARLLAVHPRTLILWVNKGRGPPHFAIEGSFRTLRRYRRADVLAFREAHMREG